MAAEGGRPGTTVEDILLDESYRFDFFQAVRLLERLYPERSPVGLQRSIPSREIVRFRSYPSLDFPPSQVVRISAATNPPGREPHAGREPAPLEMTVSFMGMIGALGVLPIHITELVAERARYKDRGLWEFLDLFSHRMVSLFYRAWERYRFTVAFERNDKDDFTSYLFGLVGFGTRGLRENLVFPDKGLLLYSGLVSQRPHSASGVEAVLGDYFGVKARVTPFTGQWLNLDDESLTRLGAANSDLGLSTIAGSRVWDVLSKFRLSLGPLTLKEFRNLLPSSSSFQVAKQLVKLMSGIELEFDLQLILKAAEVPDCKLGADSESRPMLGWTSWLKTKPFAVDASQVIFSIND